MSGDLIQALATVPDLRIGDEGPVWRDSLGRDHALTHEQRILIAEVAVRLKCSVRTVRRRANNGELGPVARFSREDIQLFSFAVDDFIGRSIIGVDCNTWRDSLGREHDLARSKRLSISEVAVRLKRSVRTVRRRAARNQLGPVVRFSAGDMQLFECGVVDFETRGTAAKEVAHV